MAICIGITCNYLAPENRLSGAYVRAVAKSGAVPLLLPVTATPRHWRVYLEMVDGLVLSGGGDVDAFCYGREAIPAQGQVQPERDRMEIYLARRALTDGLPVLGICRGAQVLNISAGGTLFQDLQGIAALQHNQRAPGSYPIHTVLVRRPSLLYRLVGQERIRVNSFHHQAIHHTGAGLHVSAEASDGVIEAVEASGHPFALGVQWHPEWQLVRQGAAVKIFTALKEAAGKSRKKR
jgi:putative glutamine amidotransferase